jgi:hypothetical protein
VFRLDAQADKCGIECGDAVPFIAQRWPDVAANPPKLLTEFQGTISIALHEFLERDFMNRDRFLLKRLARAGIASIQTISGSISNLYGDGSNLVMAANLMGEADDSVFRAAEVTWDVPDDDSFKMQFSKNGKSCRSPPYAHGCDCL